MIEVVSFGWLHDAVSWLMKPAMVALLAACGQTMEQRAATGAVAGAVVAGPVGAAVGGAAGAARPD